MPDSQFVQPQLRTTPTETGLSSTPVLTDLLTDAVRRLRLACVIWIVLWTTSLVVNHLILPHLHLPTGQAILWPPVADILAVVCIVVSGLVYWYAPIACRRAETLVDLGIAYEVVLAFAMGVINQWKPQVLAGMLSWICVLVLLHPMIVPGPPRKILIGSLLAASMDPVGLGIARLRGVELPSIDALVWAYLPNYICAALAVVPSHVLQRLSRQVSRAREMGSYRLGDLIGRGGMGEVWHAHHRLLARPAAIKLIKVESTLYDTPGAARLALQRFRREAEAAASLRSPHTIQLYDFGVTADGRFYLVMELLDGMDLESLVRRFGPQPPQRVIHLLRQACHSLAEAHAAGLVHRDIKPANLHLCRLGLEYDFLKVLDFGLVKHETSSAGEQTLLSGAGLTTGTPAYMAPELVSGDPIDGRLDLYSLGCVGYFLLTGELVFEADNVLRMIGQHLRAEPIPPSIRSGRAMPAELECAILACLAKEPAGRPASAIELSRSLATIDVAPWSPEDAQAWWETHLGTSAPPPPVVFPAPWPSARTIALSATLLALLAPCLLPPAADAQACPTPYRVSRDEMLQAMSAHGAYSLTSTTTSMRFGAEALLAIVRRRQQEASGSTRLLIDQSDWFAAHREIAGVTYDEMSAAARAGFEHGQDAIVDYGPQVLSEVLEGPAPLTALDVTIFWPDSADAPSHFSYQDTLSVPRVEVYDDRVVRFKLLAYEDMLVFDQVSGISVKPLGFLSGIFSVLGKPDLKQTRIAVSADEWQVMRGQVNVFAGISKTGTAAIEPGGRGHEGTPVDRPDLGAIKERLKRPIKVRYGEPSC